MYAVYIAHNSIDHIHKREREREREKQLAQHELNRPGDTESASAAIIEHMLTANKVIMTDGHHHHQGSQTDHRKMTDSWIQCVTSANLSLEIQIKREKGIIYKCRIQLNTRSRRNKRVCTQSEIDDSIEQTMFDNIELLFLLEQ